MLCFFFFRFKFCFLFISIENSPCRGSKVSRDPGSSVGDVQIIIIIMFISYIAQSNMR